MQSRQNRFGRLAVIASVISILAAACSGTTPSTAPSAAASPAASPSVVAVTPEPVATGEGGLTADGKVLIRWFVGLGTGAQPDQMVGKGPFEPIWKRRSPQHGH